MAIRSREELMTTLNGLLGDNTSDEALALLDDVADTYDDLTVRANQDQENWEERYNQLDNEWRERYRQRFNEPSNNDGDNDEPTNFGFNKQNGRLTYENLFNEE